MIQYWDPKKYFELSKLEIWGAILIHSPTRRGPGEGEEPPTRTFLTGIIMKSEPVFRRFDLDKTTEFVMDSTLKARFEMGNAPNNRHNTVHFQSLDGNNILI